MHNLWLEFILDKYIDECAPTIRCCGSCQGGFSAICAFMCFGITKEQIKKWYEVRKEFLIKEWKEKQEKDSEIYDIDRED